jgi:cbb3-type cytochrome oxidase maturation protein
MTAGMYIVAVCAVGGLIAGAAFWWAIRSGQLTDASEAKYLVFDDEDQVERPTPRESDQSHLAPPSSKQGDASW